MIEEQIVYGDRMIPVKLPNTTVMTRPEVGGEKVAAVADVDLAVRQAMDNPLGMPPIRELARPGMKVLIAFDDPTVPQINQDAWKRPINKALEDLYAAGVKKKDIDLVCANALHRKFTHRELAQVLGPELVREFGYQIRCHDAEDHDNIIHLGRTESGYDVELNRSVVESDLVIYVNTYLARAFNGGWKSICVGLSTYRSIRQHHHPDIMSMSTEQNPMHDILAEMGALVEQTLGPHRFFKVETLQKNLFEVARIWAGAITETRRAAMEEIRGRVTRRRDLVKEKCDIVLYGVPQASPYAAFSRTNPFLSLISNGLGYMGGVIEGAGSPGCTVVLSTPAREDWDLPAFAPYRKMFEEVLPHCRDPYEILDRYSEEYAHHPEFIHNYRYRYAHHPILPVFASFPLRRLNHAGRVFVAGAENPDMIRRLGFESFSSVETALDAARDIHGTDAPISFTPYPVLPNRFFM